MIGDLLCYMTQSSDSFSPARTEIRSKKKEKTHLTQTALFAFIAYNYLIAEVAKT